VGADWGTYPAGP